MIVTSCNIMNCYNEPFCSMVCGLGLGHGPWQGLQTSCHSLTQHHRNITTSQFTPCHPEQQQQHQQRWQLQQQRHRALWWGCYGVWWCHGQLDISPFQSIACLGSHPIVEIQGASDLLKLLTSFTIQNLLASQAHNPLTDCTSRRETRQCKNWFRFRIG